MAGKNKEPEMTVELAPEEPKAVEAADVDGATLVGTGEPTDEPTGEEQPKQKGQSSFQQIKEQASEDDDAPVGTLTLRQIVGGDYLLAMVRNHVWLILLIVLLTTVYVGVRYQCQQDVIEISRLEKDLTDAKYRALSSSSTLTELCRQSNVLRVLHENQDTLLQLPDQPPYIVPVE